AWAAAAHAAAETERPSGERGALVTPATEGAQVGGAQDGAVQEAEGAPEARGDQGAPLGAALLAGDLETEAQEALLRGGVPRVDVLKVPHHGSSRQAPAFLAATGARAALVSVGAVNDYGHPAQVTLRRLRGLGMRLYRTDLSGDVAVVADHGHLAVVVRGR
ncbi:ComEC/Rec2 family competence protein, partial [Microbispora triticiradicis]|uniref:ComEC/Rec2 family competence protein n=1 Tax=Microbispora triticiradicis TaxID=2200763 RepID=UPI0034D53D60